MENSEKTLKWAQTRQNKMLVSVLTYSHIVVISGFHSLSHFTTSQVNRKLVTRQKIVSTGI